MKRSVPFDGKEKDDKIDEEASKDDDSDLSEREDEDKWKTYCVGKMERGFGMTYSGMDTYDTPESSSYVWWGCVLISGIADVGSTLNLMQLYSRKLTVVDNLTEHAICVKLNLGGNSMTINEGLTPCIASTAEMDFHKHGGNLFHFQYVRHRSFVHEKLDWLSGLCNGDNRQQKVRIYLVLGLHPLILAHFETTKE